MAKIGRNQTCPCGSGKKFKHCHGSFNRDLNERKPSENEIRLRVEQHEARERIRQTQQGLGRPIIAAKVNDHQMVAVGNTIYWSKSWKTFADFLADYIKRKLDPAWGNAEIAKPLSERHPLMQWYDGYCRYQQRMIGKPGEVHSTPMIGVVACYLGVAYGLYLLDHNVELQNRLINRLKNPGNFQGAYYELIVATILIKAGFTLTLEDEADGAAKHCEFAAVAPKTGKRYWVEAKMRAVNGLFGKTAADGGSDVNPLAKLIPHLNKALSKPAADERLIFIDVNAPSNFGAGGKPEWLEPAMQRLEHYEKTLKTDVTAYVFVTNIAFHRELEAAPTMAAAPFGLGMLDFNRPGMICVSAAYRAKQKHIDAYAIGESLVQYLRFPTTFDGRLPSEVFEKASSRTLIGETYVFPEIGEHGTVGTVTAATVDETAKETVVAITDTEGKSSILRRSMSVADLAEYAEYRDAYFGRVTSAQKDAKDVFELFEWLMETQKHFPREKMLTFFSKAPAFAEYEAMSDDDLRIAYCEALVAAIPEKREARAAE